MRSVKRDSSRWKTSFASLAIPDAGARSPFREAFYDGALGIQTSGVLHNGSLDYQGERGTLEGGEVKTITVEVSKKHKELPPKSLRRETALCPGARPTGKIYLASYCASR